jgi:hypothetical protein
MVVQDKYIAKSLICYVFVVRRKNDIRWCFAGVSYYSLRTNAVLEQTTCAALVELEHGGDC